MNIIDKVSMNVNFQESAIMPLLHGTLQLIISTSLITSTSTFNFTDHFIGVCSEYLLHLLAGFALCACCPTRHHHGAHAHPVGNPLHQGHPSHPGLTAPHHVTHPPPPPPAHPQPPPPPPSSAPGAPVSPTPIASHPSLTSQEQRSSSVAELRRKAREHSEALAVEAANNIKGDLKISGSTS